MGDARARVKQLVTEDPVHGWDQAWKEKITPWDYGDIQPPLKDLIESGEVEFPRKGRALVPGCGRGYDVLHIASLLGLDALGLEISSTAVDAANDFLKTHPVQKGSAKFEIGNFFELLGERFDLVYDHTFFVAIPPSLRPKWGEQMRILVKPGGYLITLAYPLAPEEYEGGPPFYVNVEHYMKALGDGWDKVIDKVPNVSSERHVGLDRMIVWKKL